MSTNYTLGPWRVGDAGGTIFGPKKPDGSLPERIAEVGNPRAILRSQTTMANATLIAKAPTMHDLIVEALDLIPRMSEDDPVAPALAEWCAKARKALGR